MPSVRTSPRRYGHTADHVPVNVQPFEQIEALENEADVAAAQHCELVGRAVRDVAAGEAVFAARRLVDQADDVQERGLAAAREPHHRHELAGLYREVDGVERGGLELRGSVAFADAREANQLTFFVHLQQVCYRGSTVLL